MRGDEDTDGSGADGFPFVRIRGPLAFVALSTAVPTPLFRASGLLGAMQLERLQPILRDLAERGLIRILALHHSPLVGAASSRKGLADLMQLNAVLSQTGAELVVHGHLHKPCFGALSGPNGQIPVIGAPSASTLPSGRSHAARWHLYTVEDDPETGLVLKLTIRQFAATSQRFETVGRLAFPVTAAR
jgi:3',5'-cyclic AMP phosphodiesterase CpdA